MQKLQYLIFHIYSTFMVWLNALPVLYSFLFTAVESILNSILSLLIYQPEKELERLCKLMSENLSKAKKGEKAQIRLRMYVAICLCVLLDHDFCSLAFLIISMHSSWPEMSKHALSKVKIQLHLITFKAKIAQAAQWNFFFFSISWALP